MPSICPFIQPAIHPSIHPVSTPSKRYARVSPSLQMTLGPTKPSLLSSPTSHPLFTCNGERHQQGCINVPVKFKNLPEFKEKKHHTFPLKIFPFSKLRLLFLPPALVSPLAASQDFIIVSGSNFIF